MYRQIAEDLQRKIESGELERGAQLATEIDLQKQYDASRNTVRDAIKWLTIRGLVETRPGQGTFVTERIQPFVTTLTNEPESGGGEATDVYVAQVEASGRTPTNSEPRVEMQKASRVIAQALRIAEGTDIVSRHQQRFIDDTPWSLQTSFYPIELVEKGATRLIQATDIGGGAVAYIAEKVGIKQAGYRDSIAVRRPNEIETTFFKLPDDGRIAVFEIHRVGYDEDGTRFRLTISVYPTDRNRFLSFVGATPDSILPSSEEDD